MQSGLSGHWCWSGANSITSSREQQSLDKQMLQALIVVFGTRARSSYTPRLDFY